MSDFKEMMQIDCSEKVEKKNGLNYLSWAWAWAEFKKANPDATYTVWRHPENHLPYVGDNCGYMVSTSITANGETHEMWLPVMDGANKAMKIDQYTYQVKEYKDRRWTGNYIDKTVEPISMFDVNKTIMRCLVKNMAMFGLGLYIYAGEDLPAAPSIEDVPAHQVVIDFGKYKAMGLTLGEVAQQGYLGLAYLKQGATGHRDPVMKAKFAEVWKAHAPEIKAEEVDDLIADAESTEELTAVYKLLSKEQQEEFKPKFSAAREDMEQAT